MNTELKAPRRIAFAPPEYKAVQYVSMMARTAGVLSLISGACSIIIGVALLIGSFKPGYESERWSAAALLGGSGGTIIGGIILMAIGEGLGALRDMAMNSWHTRASLERTEMRA